MRGNDVPGKTLLILSTIALAGCASLAQYDRKSDSVGIGSDGPAQRDNLPTRLDGNAAKGRDVFRFKTFGKDGGVINASLRGGIRSVALPLLLDLSRKPAFLHDKSVAGLDQLLDHVHGPVGPHPFYISQAEDRADMIEFRRSLSTNNAVSNRDKAVTKTQKGH